MEEIPLRLRVELRFTDENGFYARKDFEDGRYAALVPLTFGRARITVSRAGDEYGYYDSW